MVKFDVGDEERREQRWHDALRSRGVSVTKATNGNPKPRGRAKRALVRSAERQIP